MQISDLVGQYNNVTARPEMTGTKGIRKLVSTLRDMKSGNIFEGTVNSIKGGKVTLGLPNGQEVTARMDGKIKLEVGQSMFFQVKSNDGTQIAIRPYTVEGNSMNLTLMEALKSANLPVDGRNLSMVNSMMEEQMSIDRNNLSQMARIVSGNPDIDVKSLVQMQKLNIPITPEMASQFQNYLNDKQAIGQALSDFIEALPGAMINEELSAEQLGQTAGDVLQILTEGLPEENAVPESILKNGVVLEITGSEPSAENPANLQETPAAANEGAAQMTNSVAAEAESAAQMPNPAAAEAESAGQLQNNPATNDGAAQQQQTLVINEEFLRAELAGETSLQAHTLSAVLDPEQIKALSEQLKQFPELAQNERFFADGQLLPTGSSVALLNAVRAQLIAGGQNKETILSLLSGKEFQALVKDAMAQQWMLKPEEVTQKDKIAKLYEKLESQLTRLEDAVKASGQNSQNVSQLAADIRNNIQFMDQINQAYTYVQIPLKMAGQKANGELYVYTNKKNLAEKKEELTAFLHLDMDHLGSTDVSIKMRGKNVSTNFYFDNDEAFALVQTHAPILEERLKAKGYNCEVNVENEHKQVNFVEDFLKKDQPSAGLVHRYSFDMRA